MTRERWRAALLGLPAALFAAVAGSFAVAQRAFGAGPTVERPHVVILATAGSPSSASGSDEAAVVRIRGELSMLGVDVDIVVPARPSQDLATVARRLGAIAALRVEPSPPAVVIWVDPSVAAPGTPPEVRVRGTEGDPALLALRAVEVLRARLVKVPLLAPPEPGADAAADATTSDGSNDDASNDAEPDAAPVEVDASPALPVDAGAPPAPPKDAGTQPMPVEQRHPVGLSAGPALVWSPGGALPPSVDLRVGAAWDVVPRLGLEANAFLPATAETASGDGGSMDLRAVAFGAGLRGMVTDPAAPFGMTLGLGLDAVWMSFSGTADAGFGAQSGSRWAAGPYLAAAAVYRPHPVVSLRLDVTAALVLPKTVLRIAGEEVASFGFPAVLPSLAVEVRP